jgi:hypothetical protein
MQVGRFRVVSHSTSARPAAAIGIAAERGNTAPVAPLNTSATSRVRWVVERTISWLLRFKRLGRYDRTERTTLPLLTLACAIINVRRLIKSEF